MKSYHNLQHQQTYERGQKINWYRGYGANGWEYVVQVFLKNKRSEQHYVARPTLAHGKPVLLLRELKCFYGRTLADISKKLENLK